MANPLIALADCNNFFVSCVRLYKPELWHRPVVVLSNNDGCIISRSNEVKAMGIGMAEAYHKVAPLLKKKGVAVLSGNHKLYREISQRVMKLLERYTDSMEVYSIDEAFFSLDEVHLRPVGLCGGDPLRRRPDDRDTDLGRDIDHKA